MELLEIEKDLAGPDKDAALARYDAKLLSLDARVKDALRSGLPPDEYSACEVLAEAVTVSRKLLRLQVKE